MGNFYNATPQNTQPTESENIFHRLKHLFQSEEFERGEAINEVYSLASACKNAFPDDSNLLDPNASKTVTWHLDILIQEAAHMLNNPENDLFLYLKALHDFKKGLLTAFPFLHTKAA